MNNLIFLKKNNQIIQYTKNIQTILHFEKDENNNKIPILDENQIITGFKHYFVEEDTHYNLLIQDGWVEVAQNDFINANLATYKNEILKQSEAFYNQLRLCFLSNEKTDTKLPIVCDKDNVVVNNIKYFGYNDLQCNIDTENSDFILYNIDKNIVIEVEKIKISALVLQMKTIYKETGRLKYLHALNIREIDNYEDLQRYNYKQNLLDRSKEVDYNVMQNIIIN